MKILLIGNGGREHAIAWKLSQSHHQPELYFAPGNPGMETLGQRVNIDVTDLGGLLLFAQREKIDLTIAGPELPLSLGIADRFAEAGLKLFGPSQAGAQLESSKAFAKALMAKYHIPTAHYQFCPDQQTAFSTLDQFTPPYVIKEDGLAAGKGVTIAQNLEEAKAAITAAFQKEMPVVIEEFMPGQELSVLAFCDGHTILPCIAAQDYKKIGEDNTGPNTGGMGAYAPVPLATPALLERVQSDVLQPMLSAFQAEGIDYQGILYAGLMIGDTGEIRVVEFNVRFGDPETQVVLPLLDTDLVDLMLATANGTLHRYQANEPERANNSASSTNSTASHLGEPDLSLGIPFKANTHALTVVLASQGYPGDYTTGQAITLPATLPPDVQIFHAGSKRLPNQSLVTAGGRVLNITATGQSLEDARQKAYAAIDAIHFDGKTYRRDIAAMPAQALS